MEKPFSRLGTIESPSRLKIHIREGIEGAQRKSSLRRIIGFGVLEIASIATTVLSLVYVFDSLKASGMPEYLSLIFTDGAATLAYSKELMLSILESLPALSIAIALCAIVAFAWSTSRLIRISKTGIQYA